ncbi:MAG: glutathione S-transferase [Solirubrobacteraceae bacterium]|nr:glutathione S-transferase [Solirubrobacteraceae bacterium]
MERAGASPVGLLSKRRGGTRNDYGAPVMRVYHREHAGRPVRVVWVLEELDEPYELTVMNWEEGQSQEHLARHPLGRVPVLEDDQGFLFESAAICLHLAELHPEPGLLPPPATHDRALVYQWATFAPAELEPALIESAIFGQSDPERAAKARHRFGVAAEAVARALDGTDYLVAGHFGVADVLVGTALAFTARAGFAEELSPTLNDYIARLKQRPAYQRAAERTSLSLAGSG